MHFHSKSQTSFLRRACIFIFLLLAGSSQEWLCTASDFDTIGLTALRALVPGLTGAGVRVAQPEAGNPQWEVNPDVTVQPEGIFRWISSNGIATAFPNSVGSESVHANTVGTLFYSSQAGVAPGIAHVDNYEAGYFYDFRIQNESNILAQVVNQSFIFGTQQPALDKDYDDYAAKFGTLFVSGVGNGDPQVNGGKVSSPATAYNGIGVAALDGPSSTGPTTDLRSKPDITAPGAYTSFSTPLVSGAAALLLQAGANGDGGTNTSATATNAITVKALLLNGAAKPPGWTNTLTAPLDPRHGAGVLNILNSYRELRGGKRAFVVSTSSGVNGSHLPPNNPTNLPVRRGWDHNLISTSVNQDKENHYFFELPGDSNRVFTLSATLVWQKQYNQPAINDLDLFLYRVSDNTLVASSLSPVDNVEHIYARALPAGRYDLQVLKNGTLAKRVTASETYALAFDFGPLEAPYLTNSLFADGQFQSRVVGEPSQTIVLERTMDFQSWTSFRTNQTSAQGILDFSDTLAGTMSLRFYRARQFP